ncbi:MAG: DUF616 domain-containing protein, partial [Microbacteriaceae bacterium]|nr:DUF616 domain-containing protein [Microbacteriaceae bacterium]
MTTQRVVYTALFGGYEALVEQPVAAESDVPFICFTDDPTLTSESWQIRVVDPVLPTDPVRSARHLKLIGDDEIRRFAESLWIDNSVALAVDPTSVLDAWLQSDSIAMPLHSYRRSVIAEFQEILLMGLDDPTRIYEQLAHYSLTYASTLDAVPIWTALIARRHGEQSDRFGRVWRDHVFRYSRRDQLSVRVAQQVLA